MTLTCFDLDIADNVAHLVLKRGDALNTMTPRFFVDLPRFAIIRITGLLNRNYEFWGLIEI